MRKFLIIAAGMTLSLALGSAGADDAQPLLPVTGQLVPMSDTELGDITGGFADVCFLCALGNVANVTQVNISALSALVAQGNTSGILQSNN